MGSCNCVSEPSIEGNILFNSDNSTSNRLTENRDRLKKIDLSSPEDPSYSRLSQEFLNIFNDIRSSPNKYISESKDHNLSEIFFKLKPCQKLSYYENNSEEIKKYIFDSFRTRNTFEQENEIKSFINNGNISNISMFSTTFVNNDMKENVWNFLSDNEDDFEKIFSNDYNSLMIVCLPMEGNDKIFASLIFFKQL